LNVVRNQNLTVSDSGTGYIMQQSVQLRWRLYRKLERYKVTESRNILHVTIKFIQSLRKSQASPGGIYGE
jgi:hypothetical protein